VGTFEDEWARIKRDRADGEAGMQLASAHAEGGHPPAGQVKSDMAAWSKAAGSVAALRGDIKKATNAMDRGEKGVPGHGVRSAAAEQEVHGSWQRYLNALSGKCGAIQGALSTAGKGHDRNDQSVSSSFTGLDKRYKDTPAVGGQS